MKTLAAFALCAVAFCATATGDEPKPADPTALLKAYFDAKTWEEKLPYVLNPDKVKPLMEVRYVQRGMRESLISIEPPEKLAMPGEWYMVHVNMAFGNGKPTVNQYPVVRTEAGYKIDWEAAFGYNPTPLKTFQTTRPTTPMQLRLVCQLSLRYEHEYRDAERTHYGAWVGEASPPAGIFAYIPRSSEKAKRLVQILADGKKHRLILELKLVGPTGNRTSSGQVAAITDVVSETWARPRAEDVAAITATADQVIQNLFATNKLFDKKEYKAVRAAFAVRFQAVHEEAIRRAYGEHFETLAAWLRAHPDIKEDFYTAIDEGHDNIEAALTIFRDLHKLHANRLEAYADLAIATAVTWDDEQNIYDYRHHQMRTNSTLQEEKLVDARGNFKYVLDHESATKGRGQHLPWEFLVYVVNHRTPLDEREWAVKNYMGRKSMIGQCYKEVPYDYDLLEKRPAKLEGQAYTLENIRRRGGVCAHQADYAARVAQSLGVPAAFVGGEGRFHGLHAWVMWVEPKLARKDKLLISLESHGRYDIDQYYTGDVKEPQTGQNILDRDMELRLSAVGWDRQARRHAHLVMKAYPLIVEKRHLDAPARLAYLQKALDLSPYNEEAWLATAKLSSEGKLKGAQMTNLTEKLFKTFAYYPDFTWKVFDDLIADQKDLPQRTKLYERLVALYEIRGRPDLACKARLKVADCQIERKKWKEAATGLAFTIKKFPAEGRYIPQLMDKLEEVCRNFKGGTDHLKRFYLDVLPRVPPQRGDEPSEHCIKMHEKAIRFFRSNGQEQVAAVLEANLLAIRRSGRR